jgi:hypothetical protein
MRLEDDHTTGLRRRLSLLVLALFAWTVAFPGCGVKTLPVVPKALPSAAVDDLAAHIDGNRVMLTWSRPPVKAEKNEKAAGFIVYRSKEPMSDAFCPDCPLIFKRIADVPVRFGFKGEFSYTETLQTGYHYRYKVIGHSSKGVAGEDSNIVVVDF